MAEYACNKRLVAGALRAMIYVGIPFRIDGRDRDGADCWGLVRMYLKDVAGIELPSYSEVPAGDVLRVARRFGAESLSETWVKVDRPRNNDVALMTHPSRRTAFHCGVVVRNRFLLHTVDETGSVIVPINHSGITGCIVGFYRHKNLI